MLLYHMVPVSAWQSCAEAGSPYFPETYEQDGFIHLTADPAQLLPVANHFYTASRGDWVVLMLDPSKLSAPVKFGPAAPVGDKSSSGLLTGQDQQQQHGHAAAGEAAQAGAAAADAQQQASEQQHEEQQAPGEKEPLFPHLYGTIDFEAVVGELPMQRDAEGRFLSIHGMPRADDPYSDFT